ncbi:MAG: DUF3426 domain-containing protein [Pseudomonadota bacterium]|nr:DUF3426 domain-containing protein [Pseudomonadota bacterium]
MLTTCPECHTTFRVTQEHLGLRRGLVRCGHCTVVFNAYDSLLAELVAPPDEPDKIEEERVGRKSGFIAPSAAMSSEGAGMKPARDTVPGAVGAGDITPAFPTYMPETPPDEPDKVEEERVGRKSGFIAPSAAMSSEVPRESRMADEETSDSILLSELPTRIKRATPTGRPRFILKRLAALLLGGLLLLQTAVFLRAEIAAVLPATRPLLHALCQPLNCVVPLPRQLDKTAITASSLEHDAENKSRARLSLLLANRSGQIQTWPHIVLTLTDVRDAPVAQRVFAPKEYLAKDARLAAGMAAGEEQEIRLDLDTGTLAATGYALDLAYR